MPPPPPPKKHKNPKITIDDKVNLRNPPVPNSSTAAPKGVSARIPGLGVSNSPYSLRNCNQYFKITPDTNKTQKYVLTNATNTYDPDAAENDASNDPNAN